MHCFIDNLVRKRGKQGQKLWGVNKTLTYFYELKETCGKDRL